MTCSERMSNENDSLSYTQSLPFVSPEGYRVPMSSLHAQSLEYIDGSRYKYLKKGVLISYEEGVCMYVCMYVWNSLNEILNCLLTYSHSLHQVNEYLSMCCMRLGETTTTIKRQPTSTHYIPYILNSPQSRPPCKSNHFRFIGKPPRYGGRRL